MVSPGRPTTRLTYGLPNSFGSGRAAEDGHLPAPRRAEVEDVLVHEQAVAGEVAGRRARSRSRCRPQFGQPTRREVLGGRAAGRRDADANRVAAARAGALAVVADQGRGHAAGRHAERLDRDGRGGTGRGRRTRPTSGERGRDDGERWRTGCGAAGRGGRDGAAGRRRVDPDAVHRRLAGRRPCRVLPRYSSSDSSTARNASCGISTWPTCFIRFLPSACFAHSFRLRVMSPP